MTSVYSNAQRNIVNITPKVKEKYVIYSLLGEIQKMEINIMKKSNGENINYKRRRMTPTILLILCLAGAFQVDAAKVILKITKWSSDGILQQYQNNPGTYPVTQEKLSAIAFGGAPDDCVRPNGTRIFNTTFGALTSGTGENDDGTYSGNEVVRELRKYEDVGLMVDNVLIYREDWLYRNTGGGPFKEDPRILSNKDLTNVRSAIANSNLKSKNTVKIIQLLRGRGSWNEIKNNPVILEHLLKFDGIGLEFHVGDYSKDEGVERLEHMALITKWTQDNNKIGFIFTGGTPATYELPARARATYNALWKNMAALGVEKDSDHLIYFRQGARPGAHAPENENTLSAQIAELIENVWTPYEELNNNDPSPVDYTPPTGFTFAANGQDTVKINDGKAYDIAFGANGTFEYLRDQTSDVYCYPSSFAKDPLPGIVKKCFVMNVQAEVPTILHSVAKVSNMNILAGAGGFRVTTGASPAELKVTNIQGKVVFNKSGVFTNYFVPMKANGVYFIDVVQGDKRITQKYVAVHK